jgi:hypothetical protein
MEGVGARRRSEPTRHPRVDQTARPPRQMSCCNLARLFVGGAFCWVPPELGPILARRTWRRPFSEPPRLGVRAASPRWFNLPRASLHYRLLTNRGRQRRVGLGSSRQPETEAPAVRSHRRRGLFQAPAPPPRCHSRDPQHLNWGNAYGGPRRLARPKRF